MYLSGGACVMYIISGGATMERLFQTMCDDNLECRAKTLTGAEWFLVFICIAIFTSLFFPNLNSLAYVSFVGSITALAYCSFIWILSLSKGRPDDHVETTLVLTGGDASQIRNAFTGFEMIALAFRGHNLVLEIQGTLHTNGKHPSRKPMWRGVAISYLLIAMCMYPLAIAGYWAYGDKITRAQGILGAFTKFHQNNTSKYLIGAIYLLIIINYLCGFQIYAMPTFDNFVRLYVSKKNRACPKWVRSAIKLFFGGLTYLIAVAFPFLPILGMLIGAIALPLTFVYPCFMWIAIKKPQRCTRTWCLNMGLGSLGVVLCVTLFGTAIWSLVVDGLQANFFNPK
ncbi:hypothetical protein ACS0TY_004092 [Phlomoides rotata]